MPFLTGLAIITLAPLGAAQSFNFAADAKLDALGWVGLVALVVAATALGRAVHRAVSKKRRRASDARLAALADPRRRWLAPSATFDPTPRAEPQMRRVQISRANPQDFAATPAAVPGVAQAQPAAAEPIPQAQPQTQSVSNREVRQISATLVAAPEAAQAPTVMPEPAAEAISVPAPEAAQAPPVAPEPVPQDLPPTREQLFVRAMRVPVVLVPLPKHVQQARLAGLMAPPPVIAPEVAPAPPAAPEPAAQAISCPAPEAAPTPSVAPEPVPQELPPTREQLFVRAMRVPVVLVPLPKHVQEARLAGLMAPPLVAPELVLQAPPPKPAHVPASTPFSGGHVLASGLDARVFLRYRHWTGVVGDSIFQLYQVRAAWQGGRIAQLHGYCFTLRACQIIPMQDVLALGDERTGNFIFDLDAFLLGTPVQPNPFGITLSPRGEHLGDPDAPLFELPAAWLEWQNLLDQQAQETARALGESAALRRVHQLPARPRGRANRSGPHKSWSDFAGVANGGARFLMRYLASDALLSDRIVRVSSISLSEDGAILSLSAHCERADALRTFRRERIAALGDAATGALHADIDAALRGSNVSIRQSRAVPPKAGGTVKASPGRGHLPALEEARQAFAAMAPDERLASATRPAEPTPPKEKRPRGRPRKNAAPPPE